MQSAAGGQSWLPPRARTRVAGAGERLRGVPCAAGAPRSGRWIWIGAPAATIIIVTTSLPHLKNELEIKGLAGRLQWRYVLCMRFIIGNGQKIHIPFLYPHFIIETGSSLK